MLKFVSMVCLVLLMTGVTSAYAVNLSPLATATASSFQDWTGNSYPPAKGIDGDMNTRWSLDPYGVYPGWFQLEWATPVSLTGIRVYEMGELAWSSLDNWIVNSWDGAAWVEQANVPKALVWDATFAVVTTKIQMVGPITFWEVESYGNVVPEPSCLTTFGFALAGIGISAFRRRK